MIVSRGGASAAIGARKVLLAGPVRPPLRRVGCAAFFQLRVFLMLPWVRLGSVATEDGVELKLMRRGGEFSIMLGTNELMNSRLSGSEEALATLATAEIAERPEVIFTTFGDAMRVPGKQGSLLQAKARGADIRIVYSPMDALKLAQENPTRKVVFFGLGFETTMPTTAITLQQAKQRDVQNFYFFCQHITLIPTLRSLLEQPDNGIDAFLAPGHVSMVIGTDAYNFIASDFHRPLVVAGFEPLDLLQGVVMLIEQKIAAHSQVENQYRRVVPDAGNLLAQQAIAEVFCVNGDSEWRGLGVIESSGVHLTPDYQRFDAEAHFQPAPQQVYDDPRARCGEVLTGRCKPHQCPLFGKTCNPETAFGALMVSSEGACAAWYQYRQQECEA